MSGGDMLTGGAVRRKLLSSLSKVDNDLMFPSIPKGENVEIIYH